MKGNHLAIITAALLSVTALPGNAQKSMTRLSSRNPFSQPSTLPYQAPPFDKIKDADYLPALEAGLQEKLAEVEKIAANPAAPTFENTLVAFEKSGRLLTRVENVFSALTGANTNPVLQQTEKIIAPKMAANQSAIYLNTKLFKRIETLYNQRNTLSLDPESLRLLERTYQRFVLAGARLSEAGKAKMKALNEEEATLRTKFTNELVNAGLAGALLVAKESDLDGLSANEKGSYAKAAADRGYAGKWLIPLQNTTQQPPLQALRNRSTRQRLFEASWKRAEKGDSNDTRADITRIAAIRAEKAKLMGFETFAAWKLQDQMAQTPEVVSRFFADLVPAVTAKAKTEAGDIQKLIDQQGGGFALAPWDWDYYAEQVRQAKYNLNEEEIKPYFELNKVVEDGVFYAANLLYGLTFAERKDIPVYQPDVRVYEVFDKNGKSLALFYGDYFKRDNKRGGAWMSNFVEQSTLEGTQPVIYNVLNITKPAPGQPALISFDNVRTLFHEFGHALHGMFATQKYASLSGTNVARDFVEFPSQFNEHWALDPKVLPHYAVHYQTGQAIPAALVEKIKKAASFNTGYSLTEAIAASMLDMAWHTLPAGKMVSNVDEFEKEALHKAGLDLPQVPPRYRSSYFNHIWGSGYAAGYYAYQWTKMLEENAFAWFEQNGGLTRANGQRFRDLILSRGNTVDYNQMFQSFTGSAPDTKALIKNMGLTAP